MKYWLLTTEYPPLHGGGISTYCYHTAKMLTAAGYAVTVFVNDDSIADYTIVQEPHCRVLRFNANKDDWQSFLGYTARLSYAFAIIVKKMMEKEGKPDCLEAQDYLGIAYYLTQFKHAAYPFMAGIPIIITIHSPAFIYLLCNRVAVYRYPDYWTGEMEKQSIVAADKLISPSNYMAETLKKHISLTGNEPLIIPNPYQSTAIEVAPAFTRNKIVYYGKLSMQKGSFALLELFKTLWDKGFPHPLYMIGGTDIVFHPEMKTMGELVKTRYAVYLEKGLLVLQGKIQPAAISQSLSDAHVVIVPSIVDNMPYVVMEAMSLGKIVLASVQGGQAEMMENGISGFLFDHNDPGSFGRQLAAILSMTDEAVKKTGMLASQRIKDSYSYDAIRDKKTAVASLLKNNNQPLHHFPFLYQETTQPTAKPVYIPQLLSVVIPFYNMGAYIEESIAAVLQSAYKKIEILIVDDGSTDAASIAKLNSLDKQENIRVISRPHLGLAATRNYGAAAASGEFLAFLDADDKVHAGYYEKAIALLQQKNNVYFVGCWVQYFENSRNIWPTFTPQPPYVLVHNPVNSSSLVYKRSAFLAGGLNDSKVDYGMEDYESVVQMLRNGFNGVVLPEILFYYRVRSGSMFRNITHAKLLYCCKHITEKHHSYYEKFALQVINLLNANGPGYLYDNPTFEISISAHSKPEHLLYSKIKSFIKKRAALKKIALKILQIKSGI